MILLSIDDGGRYERHHVWPIVICADKMSASVAELRWLDWRDRIAQRLEETDDDNYTVGFIEWLKQNPPPWWHKEGYPEVSDIYGDWKLFTITCTDLPVYDHPVDLCP